MGTKKYNWITTGLCKGINPDDAVAELSRIETAYGSLTAENILAASTPSDALFHKLFTWDDNVAATKYRLSQARTIINNIEVVIVSDGKAKNIPVYEVVSRDEGRVYKHVTDFSTNDIKVIQGNAVKALNYWKNKLAVYKHFDTAIQKIDEAISEVDNTEVSTETLVESIGVAVVERTGADATAG